MAKIPPAQVVGRFRSMGKRQDGRLSVQKPTSQYIVNSMIQYVVNKSNRKLEISVVFRKISRPCPAAQ